MENKRGNKIKPPDQCSAEELEEFYQLLLKGEAVENNGLKNGGINRAKLLAFHYENQTLVGIAAIKSPIERYKNDIFLKAETKEVPEKYPLEFGYAVTLKGYEGRHICSCLTEKLIRDFRDQNIYATTKTTNVSMQIILKHNDFKRTGKPYKGKIQSTKSDGYLLQLFVRHAN